MAERKTEKIMDARTFTPAARILSAFIFAAPVSVLPNCESAFAALVLALSAVLFFKPNASHFVKRAVQINIFILFIWLLTPWTTPGEPLWGWVTKQGVELSALVTIKANALFMIFITLVSSLSFSQLAYGFHKIGFSDKLVAIILFCARGIDIFEKEYRQMVEAAKLRGFVLKADRRTYRTVAAMISLLFARAVRRSRVLDEAMKLRGFNGKIRTLDVYPSTRTDVFMTALFCASAILLSVYGWTI